MIMKERLKDKWYNINEIYFVLLGGRSIISII